MKTSNVTVEQFARWSFERDKREVGEEFKKLKSFEQLPAEDKRAYYKEAKMYLELHPYGDDGSCGWPLDILKKVKKATI